MCHGSLIGVVGRDARSYKRITYIVIRPSHHVVCHVVRIENAICGGHIINNKNNNEFKMIVELETFFYSNKSKMFYNGCLNAISYFD